MDIVTNIGSTRDAEAGRPAGQTDHRLVGHDRAAGCSRKPATACLRPVSAAAGGRLALIFSLRDRATLFLPFPVPARSTSAPCAISVFIVSMLLLADAQMERTPAAVDRAVQIGAVADQQAQRRTCDCR